MWRQCAHSAVLPGGLLWCKCGRSILLCTWGHGRWDETLQDCILKPVPCFSEKPSCSNSFFPGTGGSSLLLNERSEKRFLSSWKYVIWSGAGWNALLPGAFLTKIHLPNKQIFSSRTVFLSWFPCAFFLKLTEPFSSLLSHTYFPKHKDTAIFLTERVVWKN